MTLYQLLRERYSENEIKAMNLNSVITSSAIEGVDVSCFKKAIKRRNNKKLSSAPFTRC